MFIGEYQHAIDGKGRLAIPAKFRKQLARQAVVTRGLDNCLFVYPLTEWKELAEKLAALPMSQANSRAFARLMLAGAMEKGNSCSRIIQPTRDLGSDSLGEVSDQDGEAGRTDC